MRIAIVGYGKMGKIIEKLAIARGHSVELKINASNTQDLNSENLKNCDIAIEFTNPESALKNILTSLENNTPTISGSTGWLDHIKEVNETVERLDGSFLYASNFSLGVNVLFQLNERLAQLLGNNKDYKISIDEIHHLQKKDAPSGTAITLANGIMNSTKERYSDWSLEANKEDCLPIHSHREAGVHGTHNINYVSEIDKITLSHEAYDRKGFALGALLAAEFIYDKKGIFTMKDVINV